MTSEPPRLLTSTRLCVALISFVGCAVIYSLRINLSMALVCMLNETAVAERTLQEEILNGAVNRTKPPPECQRQVTVTEKIQGTIDWTKKEQGLLLGSFFFGYLCTQILGGWMAQKFGATRILSVNVLVSILVTFFTPMSTAHLYLICLFRGILGFVQGVTFPAFHTLWSVWSPPMERSILTSISYAGCQVGNLITLPMSSLLCQYGFAGGWPSIFYVLGIFGALWLAVWIFYVSDTPRQHKFIAQREKEYICDSLTSQLGDQTCSEAEGSGRRRTEVSTPWKHILTSPCIWAIIAAHWSADWATYTMLTCLPSFLKDVLQMDIGQLGFLSAVPYVAYFLCINVSGFIADFLRSRQLLSTANTRKLMLSIALISQAVFLLAAGYCGCGQEYLIIAFLTLGVGLSGFQYAGVLINYMDVAPRFAGTILGIGNTLSCLSGILSPYAMGLLTPNGTRQEWLTLFWLTAAILIVGTLIYIIFAKGEVQPWALMKYEDNQLMVPTGDLGIEENTTSKKAITKM